MLKIFWWVARIFSGLGKKKAGSEEAEPEYGSKEDSSTQTEMIFRPNNVNVGTGAVYIPQEFGII